MYMCAELVLGKIIKQVLNPYGNSWFWAFKRNVHNIFLQYFIIHDNILEIYLSIQLSIA